MKGRTVKDLYVTPKDGLAATFVGRIAVLDDISTLVEAAVRPARHMVFGRDRIVPDVSFRQQYAPADSFWLPVDLTVEASIEAASVRQIGYDQMSRISAHAVNEPVPERVHAAETRTLTCTA